MLMMVILIVNLLFGLISMKYIDRTFIMLSNVFMALKDFPDDIPDDELVKA